MIDDGAPTIRHQHQHVPRLRPQQPRHGPLQRHQASQEQSRPRIRPKQPLHLGIALENGFPALDMDLLHVWVDEESMHGTWAPVCCVGLLPTTSCHQGPATPYRPLSPEGAWPAVVMACTAALHWWGPALQELNHEDDNSDDQQQMDEASHSIGGGEAQEPQNQQDHKDGPEHVRLLSSLYAGGITRRCRRLSALRPQGRGAGPPAQVFSPLEKFSLLIDRCTVWRIAGVRQELVRPVCLTPFSIVQNRTILTSDKAFY